MLLSAFNKSVLSAALSILPAKFDSPEARVMLLAIGLQESELCFRHQIHGPAHGCWMFELAGVQGVVASTSVQQALLDACKARGVLPNSIAIYGALVTDDVLAAAVARLLLWTDPHPLPAIGDMQGAWSYYLRNWEPGKPRFESWPENYARAVSVIHSQV